MKRILTFGLSLVAFSVAARAQNETVGSTPAGLAPGAPAGSYALSGFDNVNFFNGHMNFRLPLLVVNGRGGASYQMAVAVEQTWTSFKQTNEITGVVTYHPEPNWWTGFKPGYGPGVMQGRKSGTGSARCNVNTGYKYTKTLTRLTFTAGDGTEYEFRDRTWNGEPQWLSLCTFTGINRGKVFVTSDGSAATFISDADINDTVYVSEDPVILSPSGDLFLRDGTRYRIDSGKVTWIRDRNGNKLSFLYDSFKRVTSITDSLNRQITVVYAAQVPGSDTITYKGFGGATRTISVNYDFLANALRSGQTLQTFKQLFPDQNGSNTTNYNPSVIKSVTLPNNQQYQLLYNSYGEVARAVLPTGGAMEYDYAAGLTDIDASGSFGGGPNGKHIYRRVIERRLYPAGASGSAYESKTIFSRPETTSSNLGYVIVEQCKPSGVTGECGITPALLAKQKHYFQGSARSSFYQDAISYGGWMSEREYQTDSFDVDGTTVLGRTESVWQQRAAVSWWTGDPNYAPPNDPRLSETKTTLVDTNQIAKQTFAYDDSLPFNNRADVYEYDFGTGTSGSLVRRTHTEYLKTNPINGADYACDPSTTCGGVINLNNVIHIRSLPTLQQVFDGSGAEKARTVYEYDNYVDDSRHKPLVVRPGITGHDTTYTASFSFRGNPTGVSSYANASAQTGPVTASKQYDVAGNIVAAIDGMGRTSSVTFSDSFCNGTTCGGTFNSNTFAFPTSTTSPVPDPTGQFGSTTAFVTSSVFDFWTGQVTSATDANNQTTTVDYNDPLDRPKQNIRAVGTPSVNQTTFNYDDVARIITTTRDLITNNDNLIVTKTFYDGLGRVVETRQYEGGTNYIVVQTQYDAMGRSHKTSNPYRPWQSESAIWTTTTFDALGRVRTVTTPDNSVVTTDYSGNTVTVTDQIGKKRKTVTDALGRLKEIYEDPLGVNYQTSYIYNVLDDLIKVTQGSQQRFFMYDSLRRLIRARNPEQDINTSLNLSDPLTGNSQWCMAYQYDNNGNLTQKTDARGVISTYAYDALNRNTTIDYSDTTPDSFRQYDQATNGKGRLNQAWQAGTTTSATYIDSYDALGRPLIQRQRYETGGVWSSSYQIQRAYNRAGGVTLQTYPSGRTVAYAYDSAGRLNSFTGYLGDGLFRNYSTEVLYSPFGGIAKEKFGTDTPLYNKSFYNSRGQLSEIRVGTTFNSLTDGGWERGAIINHYSSQCWGACNGTDNNGNLKQQDHWIPDSNGGVQAVIVQGYTYDSLNRLQRVQEGNWQQEFVYDRWGNRTIHQTNTWGTGINKKDFTVNTANNRLGVPAGQSGVMTYDAAGNLTNDTYTGAGSRVYDAENRMTKAWGGNNQWQEYSYNPDGQRTRRKIDGVETWQIYGMEGELLAEYAASAAPSSPQKEYGYRNGQLLVTATVPLTSGVGLQAQYYDNMNFTDLKVTRLDATVNFDWGGGTPDPVVGVDTFTARWTGKVEPQYSQTYTFYTTTDDGVRLWVNGQLLIDKWIDQGPTEWSGSIALTAGQRYDIVMEFYENGGGATAKLSWSSASQPKQIIPQSRLYPPGSSSQVTFEWLVADQLGTPRIILDKTGSLATTKRHDYLPFGEELFAGVGGRTTALGYTADTVRQKFTSKERDNETGLDYFGARYYASAQGRFTSPDPLMASAHVANPQTWNRYTYALNNPLKYVDPDGMKPVFRDYKDLTEDERRILENSTVTFGKGKNAKTLSGEALYNHMKEHEKKQLAGFLNMTAGLASIKFSDGSRAIDYVKGITGGNRERIYANVDAGLKTQMETITGKTHAAGKPFIGPGGQAKEHKSGGINYDVTFRENLAEGPMQLSFASKENFTRLDMDMDEHCQNCADASARAAHIVDGAMHKLTGGTNPEDIHKLLTERKIYPSYKIEK